MQPVTRLGVGIGCLHRERAKGTAGQLALAGLFYFKNEQDEQQRGGMHEVV